MALHIFKNAVANAYDKALILSNDSDLIPAIKAVKETFPAKTIKIVFPPGFASNSLQNEAHDYMRLKERHLKNNQFPDPLVLGAATIYKPTGW